MRTFTPEEQQAIATLREQAAMLNDLFDKGVGHSDFIGWRSRTQENFARYLPGSIYSSRFAQICFDRPPLTSASDIAMGSDFLDGLVVARRCLEGAIEYIEQFGLEKAST